MLRFCAIIPLLLGCLISNAIAADMTPPNLPGSYEEWVKERVGPVIYPSEEKPRHGWDELTTIASEMGTRAVKTWVGPREPGDALKILQTPAYRRLIKEFPIVHFNLSPYYTARGLKDGKLPTETINAIKDEWRNVVKYLCEESEIPGQIFLMSVGGEINVYFGTKDANPVYPVSEYVNACHDAVTETLSQIKGDHPKVYTVAEIQTDKEYEAFCERWVPEFRADLIALSHYTFYRDLKEAYEIIKPYVKPMGPFGANRFMLGEYGPTMEICNWNQAAQVRANDIILHQAHEANFQFAFFYEVADEPTVIRLSGHDGPVAWNKGDERPYYRLLWHYYHDLFKSGIRSIPSYELFEIHDKVPPNSDPSIPNLMVEKLSGPVEYVAGQPIIFEAVVKNVGKVDSPGTVVSFFVDDVLVSWSGFPAMKSGESTTAPSDRQDKRFVWKATEGPHLIKAIIDRRRTITESTRDDNSAEMWINVKPAARIAE